MQGSTHLQTVVCSMVGGAVRFETNKFSLVAATYRRYWYGMMYGGTSTPHNTRRSKLKIIRSFVRSTTTSKKNPKLSIDAHNLIFIVLSERVQ